MGSIWHPLEKHCVVKNVADMGIPRTPVFGHHDPKINKKCDNVQMIVESCRQINKKD